MPLFKVWSEDKLNSKFVVAENFAELVSKGIKRFCLCSFVSCVHGVTGCILRVISQIHIFLKSFSLSLLAIVFVYVYNSLVG